MLGSFKFLQKFIAPRDSDSTPDISLIAPEDTLLVVGDIHGSFDLLQSAVRAAEDFVTEHGGGDPVTPKLVFVGDYIDRGESSAEVLEWVYNLHRAMPEHVICLMGNHERMLLEFLDDPAGRGERWLRNGGLQTLASYKIANVRPNLDLEELTAVSAELETALPAGMIDWLRSLPRLFQSGNVCIVHAAMDPHLSVEQQSPQVLIWGHSDFLFSPRDDDLWVVHGHTIFKEPTIAKSRISIDTGAYHTGKLTIAALAPGFCDFIQTGD